MKMFRCAALAVLALGGCAAHVPQTSSEFRQVARGGAFMLRTHSAAVPQPFEAVIANLRKYAMTCLSTRHFSSIKEPSSRYEIDTSVIVYHPTLKLVGPKAAELTLQMGPRGPFVKTPPDGPFIMVVDIEPSSAQGETRLTVYGRTTAKEQRLADESLPSWARGVAASCPLE
jgi:hypothetical protein